MMNGLTAQEVEHLRQRLRDEHTQLRREVAGELVRSGSGRYAELAGQVHDSGEEAVADLLRDLELATLDRHVQRLRRVESALARIAKGSYGVCTVCGAPIGSGRLEADPAVERCIDCQSAVEQGRHPPTL